MIVFLFKSIMGIILFTLLMATLVGSLWVLKVMLNELLDDEITEKIRRYFNGAAKIMGELLDTREGRSSTDREGAERSEGTIQDGSDLSQEIFLQPDDAYETIRRGREEV